MLFFSNSLFSQGEARQWRFGNFAGLDFNTNPPTVVNSSAMSGNYSSVSMADAAGNLLFYSNGATVWNSSNAIMANGTGLVGNTGYVGNQRVLAVKKPGSATIYYIFTTVMNGANTTSGLFYTELDMSLASGSGSVTAKNIPLITTTLNTVNTNTTTPSRLTATRHCNGVDIWVVCRDWYWNWNNAANTTSVISNSFRSFLVTAAGVVTTAVVSSPTTYTYTNGIGTTNDWGALKISPNGKKMCASNYYYNNLNLMNGNAFELFDFDNTTGVVSNSVALMPNLTTYNYSWGVEFSPDGSKVYGTSQNNAANNFGGIYQWDLCAGSPTAIAASIYTVANGSNVNGQWFYVAQLAPNGKIYVTRNASTTFSLDVINNPNAAGAACNYSPLAQSTGTAWSWYSLPNFMNSYMLQHPPLTPFTHTVSPAFGCQTASFNCMYIPGQTTVGCTSTGYTLLGLEWDFGDPVTGANNTSTLTNPFHAYSTLGTYTAQLVLHYSCGGGTDTLRQVVNVNIPCISVTSTSITCASLGSATVVSLGGVGPFSFTWMPTAQTGSAATGLSPGSYTLTVHDFGNGFTYTAGTTFQSLIPLTGTMHYANSVTCNGAATGTANFTNLAGGSGNENYVWTDGVHSYTAHSPSNLSAGFWSVTVTDALTGCDINNTFFITQPPALTLNVATSAATVCAGFSVALTGTASGGSPISTGPGYTYSWTAGPASDSWSVTQATGANYIYTLTAKDTYSCPISNTIAVGVINNPVLSIVNASICPYQTGTLTGVGAITYSWDNGVTTVSGGTFTDNPLASTPYTVTGAALGCTSVATASIVLKSIPTPFVNSNSPVCNGQALYLYGSGGSSYSWTGPLSYVSAAQNPTLNPANPNQSGTYQVTVTAANSCTAPASIQVTVNPTPTISISSGTVCVSQTLQLNASSFAGASYNWTGPNNFTSGQQNPAIAQPVILATGIYTVKVTSVEGCTNAAITSASVVSLPVPSYTTNSPLCYGSNLVLNAGGTTGGISYSWFGPNSFVSSQQTPTINGVTVPASGVYTLVVLRGPCAVSYTSTPVVVNGLPLLSMTSPPACEGKPLHLSATGTGSAYVWTGPNGFIHHLPDTIFASATPSIAGAYSVTSIDYNGCISHATVAVTVLANPVVSATGATVCLNNTSTLTANGASTYEWHGPVNFLSYVSPAIVPVTSAAQVGAYTVTGMATNGCTSTAVSQVTTLPLPEPKVIFTNSACVGSTVTLQGDGGQSYEWNGPSAFHSYLPTLSLTIYSHAMGGTYTLAVTDFKGCKNYTTAEVSIHDLPVGSLVSSGTMNRCVPYTTSFKLQPNPAFNITGITWELDNKTYSDQFSYTFTKAGDYVLKGTFSDAFCTGTSTFAVKAFANPVADFSFEPKQPLEDNDHVVFSSTSNNNIAAWYWTIGDAAYSYSATSAHASHLFETAGTYPVAMVVRSNDGCMDTIVKIVTVEPDFNIFVPNSFTPNDDRRNELFMPVSRNVSLMEFAVFDRWGDKLFATKEIGAGWDGNFQGKACKQDVYVWKLTATGKNGQEKKMTGYVNLLR